MGWAWKYEQELLPRIPATNVINHSHTHSSKKYTLNIFSILSLKAYIQPIFIEKALCARQYSKCLRFICKVNRQGPRSKKSLHSTRRLILHAIPGRRKCYNENNSKDGCNRKRTKKTASEMASLSMKGSGGNISYAESLTGANDARQVQT